MLNASPHRLVHSVLLAAVGAVLALCLIAPAHALAASPSGSCGENAQWSYDTSTKTLTISGSGETTDWTNAMLDEIPWNPYASQIEKVVVEKGVTRLGRRTCGYLPRLASISLPDTLRCIGDSNFSGCTGLTSVVLPPTVTELEEYAFHACANLKTVDMPGVVKTGGRSFGGCDSLATVNAPAVEEYAASTFYDCPALKSVSMPPSLKRIGTMAFYKCTGLEEADLGESVETVEEDAFYGCWSLRRIFVPASVRSIGTRAFRFRPFETCTIYVDNDAMYEQLLHDNSSGSDENVYYNARYTTLAKGKIAQRLKVSMGSWYAGDAPKRASVSGAVSGVPVELGYFSDAACTRRVAAPSGSTPAGSYWVRVTAAGTYKTDAASATVAFSVLDPAVNKGKSTTVGKLVYKVTGAGCTVSGVSKAGRNAKKLVVAASVVVDGHAYPVTGMKAKAFSKARKLKVLTIRTAALEKKSCGNCLKGSKVKTVKVPKAKRAAYKKIFAKRACGKKVAVK